MTSESNREQHGLFAFHLNDNAPDLTGRGRSRFLEHEIWLEAATPIQLRKIDGHRHILELFTANVATAA